MTIAKNKVAPIRIVIPTEPVTLPAPNPETGKIEAPLGVLMAWTQQNGIEGFTGANFDALNKLLANRNHPPVCAVW